MSQPDHDSVAGRECSGLKQLLQTVYRTPRHGKHVIAVGRIAGDGRVILDDEDGVELQRVGRGCHPHPPGELIYGGER
ncbi:hypothetical protein Nham_4065 (plasmid) [Nitrobacter hamburgensis X14]|uniref:Uncharacterized protein n=1 Tax=Nitrobacter hamburgensis (strain DSM 10229 / NCIMB 13809 / X14) TaxID=323097 RepID=Q1QGC4_NITHX|nr:hypothetical protein [Nitrobacter hamburgensis]ABE64723.1 hypothetical protein Nham_4065 [Nitrobacter hamburgensis X14]